MSVTIQEFGRTAAASTVQEAVLKNDQIEVHVLSFGAILHRILVPDKSGRLVDVVLGYPTVSGYELNNDSMGAVVGRFANRIAGAKITLDGEDYALTANEGENCLHSGLHNFARTVFSMAKLPEEDGVALTAQSPDGADGFPGEMQLEVHYTLAGRSLVIRYYATTTKTTVVNITNHSYFNLNGHASGSVLGHRLSLESPAFLETDSASIPTGRKLPVAETPMDFNNEKTIGRDINANFTALQNGHGYDHCYLLPDTGLRHAAWLAGPETGIRMETLTTQPALQLYSANYLGPCCEGKDGARYEARNAVCLETQHCPDSPHHPEFPSTVLRPGVTYDETTVYKFDLAPQ